MKTGGVASFLAEVIGLQARRVSEAFWLSGLHKELQNGQIYIHMHLRGGRMFPDC